MWLREIYRRIRDVMGEMLYSSLPTHYFENSKVELKDGWYIKRSPTDTHPVFFGSVLEAIKSYNLYGGRAEITYIKEGRGEGVLTLHPEDNENLAMLRKLSKFLHDYGDIITKYKEELGHILHLNFLVEKIKENNMNFYELQKYIKMLYSVANTLCSNTTIIHFLDELKIQHLQEVRQESKKQQEKVQEELKISPLYSLLNYVLSLLPQKPQPEEA